MTKTLTEQWKNGELYSGVYYCQTKSLGIKKLYLHHKAYGGMYADTYSQEEHYPDEDIEEILSPVPSYDECQKLQKKLAIATKALEYYAQCKHLNLDILTMLLDKHKNEVASFEVYEDGETARNALKEMEGVK